MFPLNRFRYACLAAAFVALPAAAQIGPAASYAPPHFSSDAGTDSVEVQTFELRSRSLADALAEYSRQSGVTLVVEIERLPDVAVTPISGKFTRVEALRLLLSGTGLTVRFADLRTAVITGHSIAAGTTRAHALRSVVVRGAASRARGYGVTRSTSATRTDAHLLDTPQSVTVVSSELISDQAMQSVSDVVRYAPGVTMGSGEGHRDQPTIRGNNSTADFFVDGMRDDAQFFRDLYNVDRVEVLKGPTPWCSVGAGGEA